MQMKNEIIRTIKNEEFLDRENKLLFCFNQAEINFNKKNYDFEKQIDLYLASADIIISIQLLYLQLKEKDEKFDIKEFLEIDYITSNYANIVYEKLNTALEILYKKFAKNKNDLRVSRIVNEKGSFMYQKAIELLKISSRWNLDCFNELKEVDKDKSQKEYYKRKIPMKPIYFYLERMIATRLGIKFIDKINPQYMICAMPPGLGKTQASADMLVLLYSHKINYYNRAIGVRFSSNLETAEMASGRTTDVIINEKFILKIFPEFNRFYNKRNQFMPLEINNKTIIKFSGQETSDGYGNLSMGFTSSIPGKGAEDIIILDDITTGMETILNNQYHQEQSKTVLSDIKSRMRNINCLLLFVGTIYNPFAAQYALKRYLENKTSKDYYELTKKKQQFKFEFFDDDNEIMYLKDYNDIIIAIVVYKDCYDKNGQSIYPEIETTGSLKTIEEEIGEYRFGLMYRQKQKFLDGNLFIYENLNTYKKKDLCDLTLTAFATIDPNRNTGGDYFAMPICRYNNKTNKYRLTDCIYEKKSITDNDFLDFVVDKIIKENVVKIHIENNIDISLRSLLLKMLKEKNHICDIIAKQATIKKSTRIKSYEIPLKKNCEFPAKNEELNEEMKLFMQGITEWNEKSKLNDDSIDSMSNFTSKFCPQYTFNEDKCGTIEFDIRNIIRF